jgi:adenylate cyclase
MLKKIRQSSQRLIASGLMSLVVIGHVLSLYSIDPLFQLENSVYDTRLRLLATGGVDDRVVILDIDEKSLAHPDLGRWPWSRNVMAQLIETLFDDYKVRALGFDVIFAEEDRSSGLTVLHHLAKTQLKANKDYVQTLEQIAPQLDYDGRFARAIEGRPIVMGYYFSASKDALKLGELPFPVLELEELEGRDTEFASWKGFGANLPILSASGLLSGHFSPTVDRDGVIRRVPMLAQFEDGLYESLSLAMVRLDRALTNKGSDAQGLRFDAIEMLPQKGYLESLKIGDLELKVDAGSNLLVPYLGGPFSFHYISMTDLWEGKVNPSILENKLVLVGTTAPGLLDLRSTPVSGIYPGVEVHANLIAAMLSGEPGRLKHSPLLGSLIELGLAIVIGVGLPVFLCLTSVVTGTLTTAAILVTLLLFNAWAWTQGAAIPLASILCLVLLIYILNVGFGFFVESRSKRQVTELFGQYVPPELVEKMAEDPLNYSMEGRRETLTVLFSDVVGFNPISQVLKPKELAEFINHYLSEMSSVIRGTGGTLDKYIGDCIMAFWGAPVANSEHASNAVKAALGMKSKLYEIRGYCEKRGWPRLEIGIGLCTGEMVVGDMGSNVRRSYTVMGESVNTGSRLENVTRVYGSWILVSESTQQACKGIVFREVDFVQVKGRHKPIRCFEPLGLDTDITATRLAEIDRWHQALSAYRSQQWDTALSLLRPLHELRPVDRLYELFISRCEQYKSSPPEPSWDGVTTFETKKG